MIIDIVKGISVPFLGTTLGAFCVFFLKNELSKGMQKALTGFAAGVMVAASIWSLLLPALEQGASLGMWKFLPAVIQTKSSQRQPGKREDILYLWPRSYETVVKC